MTFAKRVFLIAGLYGLVMLAPQYFLEQKTGRDYPPAITHPEFFYGFIGVALAWQVAFLIIATDPVRYRALMIPSILEKGAFGIAVVVLFGCGRAHMPMLAAAIVDLLLGLLFMAAFVKTREVAVGADP